MNDFTQFLLVLEGSTVDFAVDKNHATYTIVHVPGSLFFFDKVTGILKDIVAGDDQ